MKHWKSIAEALDVPVANERALAPLDALEAAFRPLTKQLQPGDDIAVDYASALAEKPE